MFILRVKLTAVIGGGWGGVMHSFKVSEKSCGRPKHRNMHRVREFLVLLTLCMNVAWGALL